MKISKQRLLELAAIGANEETGKWSRWLREAKRDRNTAAEERSRRRLEEVESELWAIEQALIKARAVEE